MSRSNDLDSWLNRHSTMCNEKKVKRGMQVVMTSRLPDLNVNPPLPLSVSAVLFNARSKTLSSVTQIRIDCPHVRTEEGRKKGRKEGSKMAMNAPLWPKTLRESSTPSQPWEAQPSAKWQASSQDWIWIAFRVWDLDSNLETWQPKSQLFCPFPCETSISRCDVMTFDRAFVTSYKRNCSTAV